MNHGLNFVFTVWAQKLEDQLEESERKMMIM